MKTKLPGVDGGYGGVERQKGPKPKFRKLRKSLKTTIIYHNLTTGAVYTLDNSKDALTSVL